VVPWDEFRTNFLKEVPEILWSQVDRTYDRTVFKCSLMRTDGSTDNSYGSEEGPFPILVGTALSSHDLVLDPTDYNLPDSIPIPGFTLDEADILVKNHFQNGNQLLKDNQFQRLLAMVGGVGRPPERLKLILEDLYNRGLSWTGNSGAFYLLLQGCPVTLKDILLRLEKDKGYVKQSS
jgi:hypothetical protein